MWNGSHSGRTMRLLVVSVALASSASGCGQGDPRPPAEMIEAAAQQAAPTLMIAAARGDLHAVHALLAAGALLDERGAGRRTALMTAAGEGRADIVAALVTAGADVDAEDMGGHSPLMLAARAGAVAAVASLIAAGADVNHATPNGITVLMEGIRSGELGVVERLLNAGADIRRASVHGLTALHLAAAGSVPVMEHLLQANLPLDATDDRGLTPVMRAARTGKLELVQLLDAHGADLTRADANGLTVADHARRRKHWHVLDYLEQRDARDPLG
jgi:uncharacterized protein